MDMIKQIKKQRIVYDIKEYLSSLIRWNVNDFFSDNIRYGGKTTNCLVIEISHEYKEIEVVRENIPIIFLNNEDLFLCEIKKFYKYNDYKINWLW